MAQSTNSVREEMEELRSSMTTLRAEVRRMETCIEAFRTQYEPSLKDMVASSMYWGTMRRELGMHIAKWGMLATIGAVLTALAMTARGWLKGWLE